MKPHHIYFYFLKLLILIIIILMSLRIIPVNNNYIVLIDSLFKFSLGLFIILFFSTHKFQNMDNNDRILIILSGLILLLLVDYIGFINIIKNLF